MKLLLLLLAGLLCTVQVFADDLDEFNLDDLLEEDFDESAEELLRQFEQKNSNKDLERENEIAAQLRAEALDQQNNILNPVVEIDPCEKMHCGAGRVCQVHGTEAKCVCIPECPEEPEARRHVCTNRNETWLSDCAVYRQRCLCATNAPGCLNPENSHVHIDYYGPCHEHKNCSEEDMKDFPRRMRDWLFNVMRDLAERDELTEHYMQMELEAETNMTRRWANAAVWKWCDLDGDTDRSVSRHELFPIRAPLVSLEQCIAPFLESCDSNKDHRITLIEWGACLELDETDLNERCDDIHRNTPQLLG
ncbi:SPARC [Bactrocera oleae]|uniref:SPARC n=1 Tax=Bactrocera oleae TaxID=104688 RepID=UPI0006B7805E|nr:SPARC [Bactrocera oleae]XP_036217395.1 SPARC [Bactrocera oleae]XP_036217396.1 SPARC [Bactrocera oleae]